MKTQSKSLCVRPPRGGEEPDDPNPDPGDPNPDPGDPNPDPGDPNPDPGDPNPGHAERYKNLKRLYEAEAGLNYALAVFGDYIAKREKYKEVEGMEAVYFYLVTKYHWLPSQVHGMSYEDLRFVLSEEMSGWTLPRVACV